MIKEKYGNFFLFFYIISIYKLRKTKNLLIKIKEPKTQKNTLWNGYIFIKKKLQFYKMEEKKTLLPQRSNKIKKLSLNIIDMSTKIEYNNKLTN